jgi:hypothetical protein
MVTNVISLFLDAIAKLRKATLSFVVSVRPPAWNKSSPTGRIFDEICCLSLFRKSVEKIKVFAKV